MNDSSCKLHGFFTVAVAQWAADRADPPAPAFVA
jgi:hypothetical protein